MASFPPMADELRKKDIDESKTFQRTNYFVLFLLLNYLYVIQLFIFGVLAFNIFDISFALLIIFLAFYAFIVYRIEKYDNRARIIMLFLLTDIIFSNLVLFLNAFFSYNPTNSELFSPLINSILPIIFLYTFGIHKKTILLFSEN